MRFSRRLFTAAMVVFGCLIPNSVVQAQEVFPDGPDWVLAHIDVETTGLIAGYHEIVDIGVVYTDLDGNVLQKWHRRVRPLHPDRVEAEAAAINGFDSKIWAAEGALEPADAVQSLLAFEKEKFAAKKILRVAYNSKFDAAFMDHLFRQSGHDFDQPNYSYFWLDIPSMAWFLGYRELSDLSGALGVEGTSDVPLEHTGLGCAEANVRIYRALLAITKKKQP